MGVKRRGPIQKLLTEETASGRHRDIKDEIHQTIKQMVLFRLLQWRACSLTRTVSWKRKGTWDFTEGKLRELCMELIGVMRRADMSLFRVYTRVAWFFALSCFPWHKGFGVWKTKGWWDFLTCLFSRNTGSDKAQSCQWLIGCKIRESWKDLGSYQDAKL